MHFYVLEGRLCNADLELLKNWRLNPEMHEGYAEMLTRQGKEDMTLLARRLQNAYPHLLNADPQSFTFKNFQFLTSNSERTQSSFSAFSSGLTNPRYSVPPIYPQVNDTLLRVG